MPLSSKGTCLLIDEKRGQLLPLLFERAEIHKKTEYLQLKELLPNLIRKENAYLCNSALPVEVLLKSFHNKGRRILCSWAVDQKNVLNPRST
jgi:hypothetical protein